MMNSVVLARRPIGNPVETDFAVREEPIPSVPDGHFLTRNDFISLDAGFRNWMNEGSGDEVLPAMALDAPVMGLVLSEVITSRHPAYSVGDRLMARFAWQTHSLKRWFRLHRAATQRAGVQPQCLYGSPRRYGHVGLLWHD